MLNIVNIFTMLIMFASRLYDLFFSDMPLDGHSVVKTIILIVKINIISNVLFSLVCGYGYSKYEINVKVRKYEKLRHSFSVSRMKVCLDCLF